MNFKKCALDEYEYVFKSLAKKKGVLFMLSLIVYSLGDSTVSVMLDTFQTGHHNSFSTIIYLKILYEFSIFLCKMLWFKKYCIPVTKRNQTC